MRVGLAELPDELLLDRPAAQLAAVLAQRRKARVAHDLVDRSRRADRLDPRVHVPGEIPIFGGCGAGRRARRAQLKIR